jgi:RND family efflux transporter MFP subunit
VPCFGPLFYNVMKKWIVAICVLLAAASGYWATQKWPELKPERAETHGVSGRPTTAVVETRNINFKVTAAGDIGPAEQVSVRPEINGRIFTLPVDIGDQVKKSEILFTLDDTDLRIERSSRQTEVEGAKLQLAKAERNFERSKELFHADLISKELAEDTKTEFELAKNALDRAQKNLNLVEERLTKTIISAPFDCTVLTRPVSVGQAVSGSGGFNSGTEVLTIADLNNMIVNAHINQADVTRLSPGQVVDTQVESVPGLSMKGVVDRLAPQSTIKNSVKGYAARIAMKAIDPRVRPGMTANVTIPVASSENAVAIPIAAVFTEQGERFVYVKEGDSFERRPVRIGIADYDYVEVLSGLTGGEIVSLEDQGGNRLNQAITGPRPANLAGTRAGGPSEAGTAARPNESSGQRPATARPSGNDGGQRGSGSGASSSSAAGAAR